MTIKTRNTKSAEKSTGTLSRARKADAAKVAEVKQENIVDAVVPEQTTSAPTTAAQAQGVELPGLDQNVTGRGVFAVRTLGTAVSVESAFLADDGNVLRLPAVFPNREYALEQLEELWKIVNKHFDELSASSSN